MLGSGAGSEIRQPLGYAIVGGLALSQILTLYTTPVVFLYLDRLTKLSRSRQQDGHGAASPLPSEQPHAGQ
jgi:Cu/Ag efflux pump CusA